MGWIGLDRIWWVGGFSAHPRRKLQLKYINLKRAERIVEYYFNPITQANTQPTKQKKEAQKFISRIGLIMDPMVLPKLQKFSKSKKRKPKSKQNVEYTHQYKMISKLNLSNSTSRENFKTQFLFFAIIHYESNCRKIMIQFLWTLSFDSNLSLSLYIYIVHVFSILLEILILILKRFLNSFASHNLFWVIY